MKIRMLISMGFIAFLIGPFFSTWIIAQQSVEIMADKDNTLFSEDGAISNGAGSYIFTGTTNKSALRRALVRFDLQGKIPANAGVDSVKLTLFMSKTKFNTGRQVNLHRMNGDWGEAGSDATADEGSGAIAVTGDATWSHSTFNTQAWNSPGGDYNANSSANKIVEGNGSYNWRSPGMKEDVEGWLGDSTINHGWILIGVEGTNTTSKRFNSRENAESSTNPKLTVYYSEPLSDKVIPSALLNQTRIFPNPFRDQLSIEYNLIKDASVEWRVYNILGKEIRTLVDKYHTAGPHRIFWDGKDDSGSPVNQGMYYAIIRTGNVKIVYKIIKSQ